MLLEHGVPGPAQDNLAGMFEAPELQVRCDPLVAVGRQAPVDGPKVGALTDAVNIQGMYDNLFRGSRNHLQAFNDATLVLGVRHASQVTSQHGWEAIAQSARDAAAAERRD